MTKFRLLACLLLALSLSGCLIPEQFQSKITIDKDGGFTFVYDGPLTCALAAAKRSELTKKDEEKFRRDAEKMMRDPSQIHPIGRLARDRHTCFT